MNKQELTEKIVAARQQLEAALARVGEEHMLTNVLPGQWSVKDLIGHLGFWEQTAVTLFYTLKAGHEPGALPSVDTLNAQALAETRQRPLAEVRSQEKTAYERVLLLIQDATPDELFDPSHFAWTAGEPFVNWIADNTYGHYEEHVPDLLIWLKRIA